MKTGISKVLQLLLAVIFVFSCGSKNDAQQEQIQGVIDSLKRENKKLEEKVGEVEEKLSSAQDDATSQRSPYTEISLFVKSVMKGKTNRQTIYTHGSRSFIQKTMEFENFYGKGTDVMDYLNSLWGNPLSGYSHKYKVYVDDIKVLNSSPTRGEAQVKFKWVNKANGTRDYNSWPQQLIAVLIYEDGRWVFDDLRYANGKTAKEYLEDPFIHEYKVIPPSVVQ